MAGTASLFETGSQTPNGPEYDLVAAAHFYDVFADNAEAVGMEEEAQRLRAMATIDKTVIEESVRLGLDPIFMHPNTYPIKGEPSTPILMLSGIRALIINPGQKQVQFAIRCEVDTEHDTTIQAILADFESLVMPADERDVQRIGYIDDSSTCVRENDPGAFRTTHSYRSVLPGIAVQTQETRLDGNWGASARLPNGEFGPLPPLDIRRTEITVFQIQKD